MVIESFEELEEVLRGFESWEDRGGYDFGGAMILLGACLDNLRRHAVEDELVTFGARLDGEQVPFFLRLAEMVKREAESREDGA